eukprot:360701-Pyramimonas_sp.AAC.1
MRLSPKGSTPVLHASRISTIHPERAARRVSLMRQLEGHLGRLRGGLGRECARLGPPRGLSWGQHGAPLSVFEAFW